MNTLDTMKQALEALEIAEKHMAYVEFTEAITSLRQAIATEESSATQTIAGVEKQEPVALMVINGEISYKSIDDDQSFGMWCPVNYDSRHSFPNGTRFYTHPQPKREWVGLDPEEIRKTNHHMVDGAYHYSFKQGAEWAEAKLKEKNT